MDIVSRLKRFIEAHQIPVTQFADNCQIPRPTFSQLLNGRNKKVSDEVISKIHTAYPALSMLWLMFGEGNMETPANLQISEPQIPSEPAIPSLQQTDRQDESDLLRFDVTYIADSPENMAKRAAEFHGNKDACQDEQQSATKISFDPGKGKRVISIVVYYDDKSYESFVPDPSSRSPFA